MLITSVEIIKTIMIYINITKFVLIISLDKEYGMNWNASFEKCFNFYWNTFYIALWKWPTNQFIQMFSQIGRIFSQNRRATNNSFLVVTFENISQVFYFYIKIFHNGTNWKTETGACGLTQLVGGIIPEMIWNYLIDTLIKNVNIML